MGPKMRRHIRRLAELSIEGGEALARCLYRLAERPRRARPLCFPTAGELLMQDLMRTSTRRLARRIVADLSYDHAALAAGYMLHDLKRPGDIR